jgi:hypothetical protein
MNMEQFCLKVNARHQKRNIWHRPTCSLPLNTYNLQPRVGFLASGGSLYFRIVLVPSVNLTAFVSAANNPELAKFGLALSIGGGDLDRELERGRAEGWMEDGRFGDEERREETASSLLRRLLVRSWSSRPSPTRSRLGLLSRSWSYRSSPSRSRLGLLESRSRS